MMKNKYWVETAFIVFCEEGQASTLFFSYEEAETFAKELETQMNKTDKELLQGEADEH